MELTIPRISGDPLSISVEVGQQLYVVGPNGTGNLRYSSTGFHRWVSRPSSVSPPTDRLGSHLGTWPSQRKAANSSKTRMRWDSQEDARWMEQSPAERQSAVLFDLVAKDNTRNRTIGQYIDEKNSKEATEFATNSMPLFRQLNDLLDLGTLKISLKNSNDEEILAQHQDNDLSYSIARMSDGERAAAIMAADVLVTNPGLRS